MRWGDIENYLYIELKRGEIFLLHLDQIPFKNHRFHAGFHNIHFLSRKMLAKEVIVRRIQE
jgi:hypothetical protein